MAKRRHVPQRTCIGCRTVAPKRAMIRIVRTPEGRIEIDPTGKRSGRGAYIHPHRSCWEAALKQGRVAHALKATLSSEDLDMLAAYAAELPEETAVETSHEAS